MYKVGFIGVGNIGEALLNGIISSKWALPHEIVVTTKSSARAQIIASTYGVDVALSNISLAISSDIIVIATKPNIYPSIIEEIYTALDMSKVLISITPSFTLETLQKMTNKRTNIIRTMPNTPSKVGKGMTGITASPKIRPELLDKVISLFDSVGKTTLVKEEQMAVVGTLSGSNPAFIEYFIKVMVEYGIGQGLSESEARLLVLETFKGTVMLVETSELSYEGLIDQVCSKGGSTIKGIESLHQNGVADLLTNALEETTKKFKKMEK